MISIRYDCRRPSFHSRNTEASSSGARPRALRSRSYVSAISWMSAYSIPLWTIFTKCPAPSGPMYVQQGTASTFAAIAVSISSTRS